MMAQPTSIVIVAVLLINNLSNCSAENVYCVTPTATSCSFCPHNSTYRAMLSEYAQEAEMYFTSNTTMVFLPGDHVLDRNITVANVATLTMHGESSLGNMATIVRNGSVGFSFTNMINFTINSLAFTSYNRSLSNGSDPASNSALFIQSTRNARLVDCSFHDNLGTALTVQNTSITLEENSKFIHNQCTCRSFNEVHGYGCGIAALNSNLRFTGKAFFSENIQSIGNTSFLESNQTYPFYCGGAIWASASSLHFNGTNTFINNSANGNSGVGGAIYANTDSSLSFMGASMFSYNSAYRFGGAIAAYNNVVLIFTGINNFMNNSAKEYGGAISAVNSTSLSFTGTCSFSSNSAKGGGAIDTDNNVVLNFNGNNSFISNSARNGVAGAIYTSYNVVLIFNGTNNFTNNSARNDDGGAIVSLNSILNFIGASDFSCNSADYNGGAITIADHALLTFTGTNNFINNSANSNGGAIFAVANVSLNFNGTSSFSINSAVQGGAISAYLNSTLTFDGNISFINNGQRTDKLTDSRGGAMHLAISSTFSISPHTNVCWKNNHANLGGAISFLNDNPLIYCTVTRIATFIPREDCFFKLSDQTVGTQLVFKNNSADDAGSVLYGGAKDNCNLTSLISTDVFDMSAQFESDNTTSSISSDPFRICPCVNHHPNCSKRNKTLSIYPGETFTVSVVAVGQRNGSVPAVVLSHMDRGKLFLKFSKKPKNK